MPRSGLERDGLISTTSLNLHDLTDDMKLVTGTCGLRPCDLTPGANDAPGEWRAAIHKQPHRESGGVSAAGGQAGEQRLAAPSALR